MTSSKPYLLRALYEWIGDNGLTPHMIVDAHLPEVQVPEHVVQDGRVVLNVSSSATRNLLMENDFVSFQARFAGVGHEIWVPMKAILAVYARENGKGMMFSELDASEDEPENDTPPDKPTGGKKGPKLRVIK